MERRDLGFVLAAALVGGMAMSSPARAATADDAAVAARVEKLRTAMLARDGAALEGLMAPDLTYGHSDRRVQNKAEVIDAIATGKSRFDTIALSDQIIHVVGDLAIVRHRFVADTVSNGMPGHPDIRILQIWQKRSAGWTMLVRQAH